jgi:hypothetical protein
MHLLFFTRNVVFNLVSVKFHHADMDIKQQATHEPAFLQVAGMIDCLKLVKF